MTSLTLTISYSDLGYFLAELGIGEGIEDCFGEVDAHLLPGVLGERELLAGVLVVVEAVGGLDGVAVGDGDCAVHYGAGGGVLAQRDFEYA